MLDFSLYPGRALSDEETQTLRRAAAKSGARARAAAMIGARALSKKELCRRLAPSIFLDGDWCWDLHPFSVTDATKALVMDNIRALLRRDLDCPEVDYVVFVWVLQQEETAAALLDGLDEKARILRITLDASDEFLSRRVQKDIAAGLRTPDSLERSLAYQRFYPGQGTLHLSTDGRSPAQLADEIAGLVRNRAES